MAIEVRQATDVLRTLIDLKNEETVKGYLSGRSCLLHGDPHLPITEEYLIETIKLLVTDGGRV